MVKVPEPVTDAAAEDVAALDAGPDALDSELTEDPLDEVAVSAALERSSR